MKNSTRKLGSFSLMIVLSLLAVQPAFAEHRRDYQQNRHHNNYQTYNQSYYNHQYQKYRDKRHSGHHYRSRNQGSGQYYANSQSYNGHYAKYNGYYSGYRSDHHRHRHGVFVLRAPTYGYTHCEAHGGYFHDGDIYY